MQGQRPHRVLAECPWQPVCHLPLVARAAWDFRACFSLPTRRVADLSLSQQVARTSLNCVRWTSCLSRWR